MTIALSIAIRQRVERVRERIASASARSGRSVDDVTLVAVTKTVPLEAIHEAIEAGVTHVGENRVQEAREKFPHLPDGVTRHLIGHLQTNKARYVGELFDVIHSIDSSRIAAEVGRRASREGRRVDALIQVNVAAERDKYGVSVDEALALVEEAGQTAGITVRGLMTMAPHEASESELRRVFGGLRELAVKVNDAGFPGVRMEHLSMGMSQDFEIAVEEGATIVRVGSAIFR